jgi:hypothetical protein
MKRYAFTVLTRMASALAQALTNVSDVMSSASVRLPVRNVANRRTSRA